MQDILSWIETWPISLAVAEGAYWFPLAEVAHVVALSMVVGSIFILDLRLLGVRARGQAATRIAAHILPWTWGAFVLAVVSGLLMFVSSATRYAENPFFLVKMGLLVLAGANMAMFHFGVFRHVARWDLDTPPPAAARAAGLFSIALWIGVVACGRWVGFT